MLNALDLWLERPTEIVLAGADVAPLMRAIASVYIAESSDRARRFGAAAGIDFGEWKDRGEWSLRGLRLPRLYV